jgi:hypothetical protein
MDQIVADQENDDAPAFSGGASGGGLAQRERSSPIQKSCCFTNGLPDSKPAGLRAQRPSWYAG